MNTTALRRVSAAARRDLKAAGLDMCVIRATTSESDENGRPVWRTYVELTGVVESKADEVAKVLRATGHNVVVVNRRMVVAVNPVGFEPVKPTVAGVVAGVLIDGDDATITAPADGLPTHPRDATLRRDNPAKGATEVLAEADAAELLKPGNARKLWALYMIADREDDYRVGIVPAKSSTYPHVIGQSLERMGLVDGRAFPVRGFKLNDRGRRALELVGKSDH